MMRMKSFGMIAVIIAAMIWGCGPRKPQESMTAGHTRIGASDAVFDMAWFLSREFQAGNQAAFIDIFRSTNEQLVSQLLNKNAEEIFLDRDLTPAETLAFSNTKQKLYRYPIAFYPVYLLVGPMNTVKALDSTQLRAILTGEITNWSAIEGTNAPINVYLPLAGEGAMQSIKDYFGNLDSLQATEICSTSMQMLEAAKDDPGALLIYSKPVANLMFRPLEFLREGQQIRPNVKTILDDVTYPFRLNITYITTHNKMDVAAGYLTFAVGNLGQRRIMDALKYRPASVPVRIIKMKK